MKGLTLANQITIGRIVVVPFFIVAVLYYSPESDYLRFVALGLFLFAGISDLADGYIARRWQQKTQVGAFLDPLADKILLMSAFFCLYLMNGYFPAVRFPIWLVVAVISLDVILLIGTAVIQLLYRNFEIQPTFWGKANTFVQVLCVIGFLLQLSISHYLWYITLILICVAGIDYIREGIKVLNNPPKST